MVLISDVLGFSLTYSFLFCFVVLQFDLISAQRSQKDPHFVQLSLVNTTLFAYKRASSFGIQEGQGLRTLRIASDPSDYYHKASSLIVRRGVRGKGRQEHDWVNHGTSQVILSKIFVRLEPRARSNKAWAHSWVRFLLTQSARRTSGAEEQFMLARRWRRPRLTVSWIKLRQVELMVLIKQ